LKSVIGTPASLTLAWSPTEDGDSSSAHPDRLFLSVVRLHLSGLDAEDQESVVELLLR